MTGMLMEISLNGATLKPGSRKSKTGIRNPESGIRNPESGIENDDQKNHFSNV